MNIIHLFALTYPRLSGPKAMRTIDRFPFRAVISVQRDVRMFEAAPYWQVSVTNQSRRKNLPADLEDVVRVAEWTDMDRCNAGQLAAEMFGDVGEGPMHCDSSCFAYQLIRRCDPWERRLYLPDPRHSLDRQFPVARNVPVDAPPLRRSANATDPTRELVEAATSTVSMLTLLSEGDLLKLWLPELQFRDVGGSIYFKGGQFAGYVKPGEALKLLPPGWVRIGRVTSHHGNGWVNVLVDPRSTREIFRQLLAPLQQALARVDGDAVSQCAKLY